MSSDKDAPPPPPGEERGSTSPRSSDGKPEGGDTRSLRAEPGGERSAGSGAATAQGSAPGAAAGRTETSQKKTKKKGKDAPPPQKSGQSGEDPLRGSRVSGVWAAVVALVVLLVLLAIFVLQNTRTVEVTYFGWSGEAPLAATLLIAVAAGLLIAVAAGSLRILQLRRRVKREKKQRP